MSIGMADYTDLVAELTALGVNSHDDMVIARLNRDGAFRLNSFEVKNVGKGSVVFSLKKRGRLYPVVAEDLAPLQVGVSDRFRGKIDNRRIASGRIVIVDANVVVPQRIEDTNGDGKLFQTDGPVGPSYPVEVGSVNYNDGIIDFTFLVAATLGVTADYHHSDWSDFTVPITFNLVSAGGYQNVPFKGNALVYGNFVAGLSFDEEEVGFVARKVNAAEKETSLNVKIWYHGEVENLVIAKGEIGGYPFHNA